MKLPLAIVAACFLSLLAGCTNELSVADTTEPGTPAASAEKPKLLPAFPDFAHLPAPADYHGRIFRLSQEYPKTKPNLDERAEKILAIDFKSDWKAYMLAVRDYVYEGNIEQSGFADDFYLEDNKIRRWYHVPWQHWGDSGREGIHGLTKEGPVMPYSLGPDQPTLWQTYAVGFYNAPGGWMIGRVWADPENPRVDVMKEGFPVGTVVGKVLFTTATVAEVPYLTSPIEWPAYITPTFVAPKPPDGAPQRAAPQRRMSIVRFIQMDIMVRDPRADETGGWVFGTFVYNGALANANMWHNAVPVGLMWGNDPTVTSHSESNKKPTQTEYNDDLKQCQINHDAEMPPMHLGWGLRLNGPVDNTLSSCMSCHATAQYPAVSPILPFMAKKDGKVLEPGSPEWMRFFRNVPCATSFDPQATTMDYSLQLAASIQNFLEAKSRAEGGRFAVQYWQGQPLPPIRNQRGMVPELEGQ